MLHIEQAIVVEGKYDKIKLSSLVDAVILVTDGFRIFKDAEKMAVIRYYARTTGIVVLTDSDSAGFVIRNHIRGAVRDGKVFHAYIPDILGKERRKANPSKEGKLGVEGMERQILMRAFEKAGITAKPKEDRAEITRLDLYEDGFSGRPDSKARRAVLLKKLNLPELLTTQSMLEILNTMMSREEYQKAAAEIASQENGVE